ncbi:MAG: hypothetical protein JWL77_3811 [Chthonomonadaceae bacterium]|nr:hypothetical protein [Chthonomonadaceae bacterium]
MVVDGPLANEAAVFSVALCELGARIRGFTNALQFPF